MLELQLPGATLLSAIVKHPVTTPGGAAHSGELKPAEYESPALLMVIDANEGELVPSKIPPMTLRLHPVSEPLASVENAKEDDVPGSPANGLFEFK